MDMEIYINIKFQVAKKKYNKYRQWRDFKVQRWKIGTILENDLNEIKDSLNNMEYSTSKEKMRIISYPLLKLLIKNKTIMLT